MTMMYTIMLAPHRAHNDRSERILSIARRKKNRWKGIGTTRTIRTGRSPLITRRPDLVVTRDRRRTRRVVGISTAPTSRTTRRSEATLVNVTERKYTPRAERVSSLPKLGSSTTRAETRAQPRDRRYPANGIYYASTVPDSLCLSLLFSSLFGSFFLTFSLSRSVG